MINLKVRGITFSDVLIRLLTSLKGYHARTWSKCEAALLEAGVGRSLPEMPRFPGPAVILTRPDARTTVSFTECSQRFPIYNLPDNLRCLTASGDISSGMENTALLGGERLTLGCFPICSEGGDAPMEQG